MIKLIILLAALPLTANADDLTSTNNINQLNTFLHETAKISTSNDSASIDCNPITLNTEYNHKYNLLYKNLNQLNLVLIPTSEGYSGVNVFYRPITIKVDTCFFSYDTEIANPVLNGRTIESHMKSGYKHTDTTFEIDQYGNINLLSERDNYHSFCVQVSPQTKIPAIDCKTHKPTVFLTIQKPKSYFYKNYQDQEHTPKYLIKGDKVHILDFKDGAGRALVTYKGIKSTTTGWINYSDLSEY